MKTKVTAKHLTCLYLFSSCVAFATDRPNIIFIFTDQHTASALSCTGNEDLNTPNIDRLAEAGILFNNAYCTAPLSGPSRAAMFTGRYPDAIDMSTNGSPIPDSLKTQTLGTLIKNAGYDCAYGGKWHLPLLEIPDKEFGFDCIHKHSDEGLAESCVEYLSRKHKKPFFLVASFDNPHNICEYARSQNLPYGNIEIPEIRDCPGLPTNFEKNPYDADIIENERSNNYNVYPTAKFTPEDWRLYRYYYYRLVEKVDREIGKIIDAIDKNNLWKNTIVIFSSDHGDGIGAHRWNQKSALYEEVINIPFIVTLPKKMNAGKVMPHLISNGVDFFASVCDWAGVDLPKGVDGKSFRSIVEGANPPTPHQDYIIVETRFDGSKTRGWVVRSQNFKYVLYDKGRYREQLFDMQKDRGETRNLIMENKYNNELNKFRDILGAWMNSKNIRPTRPKLHDVPGKRLKKNNN